MKAFLLLPFGWPLSKSKNIYLRIVYVNTIVAPKEYLPVQLRLRFHQYAYSLSQFGMLAVASFTILTRVTTLSGTPGGGNERFLGGGPRK